MARRARLTRGLSCGLILATFAFVLQAQLEIRGQDSSPVPDSQTAQATPDQDPPSRVGRLNYVDGSVSLQPSGEADWVEATVNRPLVTGDNLWADQNSRAELHIGSTALRLGPQTGITLLEVSDHVAQIRLAQGSLIVAVRHLDGDIYEIDTPNAAFVATKPGDYRIDVDPNSDRSEVTVFRGQAQATAADSAYTIMAGQVATFTGTDQPDFASGQSGVNDSFDSWALNRDPNEQTPGSAYYASPEMTGYEDLAVYGDWSYIEGYGATWRPRVLVAGWAPYRFGHWAWVGPWGWTWIADEPWGFAPFHYGRWAYAANGWVWVPGPSSARPVYAPALVAWVGGAPGFHFSFGAGVGWLPLAPGEVFLPGYRVSRAYVNRVNVSNTTVNVPTVNHVYNSVIVNGSANSVTYANRSVTGGVTVVSHDTFANAQPVGRNAVSVPANELAEAPISSAAAVEPAHSNLTGAGKPAANRPPAAVISRPVVALRTPTPLPGSFDRNQLAGHSQASNQPLVRQMPPGRPVPVNNPAALQPASAHELHPSTPSGGSSTAKAPVVWEEQGSPEPERHSQTQNGNRNAANSQNSSAPQAGKSAQQQSRSTAQPARRADERSPQQQREPEQKGSSWQQKPAATSATSAKTSQQTSHTSSSSSSTKK